MTRCLKVLREAACLQLAERLFHSFTPLNEKHFLPFSVPVFGNLRSVDVLRSLYDVLCESLCSIVTGCPLQLEKLGNAGK